MEVVHLEFPKCDSTIPGVNVGSSHPNRCWHENRRKFLSLWAVVLSFRKAGFEADLVLVNYDDARQTVKRMLVKEIRENAEEEWMHEGGGVAGKRDWVRTIDEVMPFAEFRKRFKEFNDTKRGDTWGSSGSCRPTPEPHGRADRAASRPYTPLPPPVPSGTRIS